MSALGFKYVHKHPLAALFALFVAWKALIALIVLTAPGPGYDTSTGLLAVGTGHQNVVSNTPEALSGSWSKFVRWDAIYFIHLAGLGHVFEQEWAIGIGLSTTISWTADRMVINFGYAGSSCSRVQVSSH